MSDDAPVKLYGILTSPFVRHCRIALEQGGLDWEFINGDMYELAKASPVHKVPYLVVGNRVHRGLRPVLYHQHYCGQRDQSFSDGEGGPHSG